MMSIIYSILDAWIVVLLLYLPGWSWSRGGQKIGLTGFVESMAFACSAGIAMMIPSFLFLAEYGWFQPFPVILASLLWTVLGLRVTCREYKGHFKRDFAGLVLAGSLISLIQLLPAPSEWIVGGWDPGVIINQGVWIGRTGMMHPPLGYLHQFITPETVSLFTNHIKGLNELFPGIPIDTDSGTWAFSFYRGTPLWVGFLYQFGGMDLAIRAMTILLVWIAIISIAAVGRYFQGRLNYPVLLAFLIIQPIVLYHSRTPNYEMLQLLLILSVVLWTGSKQLRARNGIVAALGFCLVVNHISFILFGGLFALCLALFNRHFAATKPDRSGMCLGAGVLLGAAYTLVFSSSSTAKLHHVLPEIYGVAAACMIAILLLTVQFRWPKLSTVRWDVLVIPLGITAWLYLECNRTEPFAEFANNVKVLSAYEFVPLVLVGFAGAVLCWIRVPETRALITFSFLSLLVVLHRKHAVDLYPWALKRYLPFVVPIIMCGGACVWSVINKSRVVNSLIVLLLFVAGIKNADKLKQSLVGVEYTGAMNVVKAVADEIPDAAIVISDHFKWGTPLAAIYGKNIINGEIIWSKKSPEAVRQMFDIILNKESAGAGLYFITSSERALSIYPEIDEEEFVLIREFPLTAFRQTIHHRSNRGFTTRASSASFNIYKYQPR